MVFSSLPFLFMFLPAAFAAYFIFPQKYRNAVLCFFSLLFYAWGEPVFILLLLFSSMVDYFNGRMLAKYSDAPKKKKLFLLLSIFVNLSLLAFFKYGGFITSNIAAAFNSDFPVLKVALPIGISFYTFQTMSYSVDVYRGNIKAEDNFIDFLTYVSMFPQLIAGPIVRYSDIGAQLKKRFITTDDFCDGFMCFVRGLGKKVLLANNIGLLFSTLSESAPTSVAGSWLTVTAYGFQIFFDFSGYSDMARGIGKCLGFSYPENFNLPYTATSITDFWRRWHISLSSFFKDYVYIPLGGSRNGTMKTIRNLIVVWLLTGFWHGANWNFALWGIYYGVLLIIEKFLLKPLLEKLPRLFMHLYTMFFVAIGWTIFAFEDTTTLFSFLSGMFGGSALPLINAETMYYVLNYALTLALCVFFSTAAPRKIAEAFSTKKSLCPIWVIGYVLIFIVSVAYIVNDAFNPFLYFRF